MTADLAGFTALITGGSSGLGLEMARTLQGRSAHVVITGRNEARLRAAEQELASAPGHVCSRILDVTDEKSVEAAATWFRGEFGHLDMLVNNAGTGDNTPGIAELGMDHAFYDIPVSSFRTIVDTNFLGYFIVSRAFAPIMVEQGRGRLVYVSTSTATLTRRGQIPYGPSKAASEAMSTILAEELRESDIAVNVICPGGFVNTGMAGPGVKELFESRGLPILRPDVLNRVILFLASPAAEGLTGQKIVGKDFDNWLTAKGITVDAS